MCVEPRFFSHCTCHTTTTCCTHIISNWFYTNPHIYSCAYNPLYAPILKLL